MGRPLKYKLGTSNISLSLPKDVLDLLRKKAKKLDKPLSEYVSTIIKEAIFNDQEYARIKAKESSRKMHYWLSEVSRLEQEKQIDAERIY